MGGALAVFNCLPNTKSYIYAAVAFGVAGVFLFLAMMVLPMIVLSPSKFVCCFSLSMSSMIVGLSLLKGIRVRRRCKVSNGYAAMPEADTATWATQNLETMLMTDTSFW